MSTKRAKRPANSPTSGTAPYGSTNSLISNSSSATGATSATTNGYTASNGTNNSSQVSSTPESTDGRKRQSKRDEAIRRKIENDLSKRRNPVGKTKQVRRPPPGTVLSLKPSPPLTMKLRTTIYEAAQFMSAKRENCVLVLDDDEAVCGIFTAKDLAFKIIGSGLDPKSVFIDQIMTPNPQCARTDTSATDALNLMVSKGFRHLPVMDENQDIAGVLDITKCFYEAMGKLERAYDSSRKLFDALEGVQSELGSSQPAQIINYVEALRTKMEGPDLDSVLDGKTPPVYVDVRTSVSEAAALMKQNKTTAVLVTDHSTITGIFTSKDVVLRVIAAGLEAKNCSVVRVMTPQPDFAPRTMSIQQALRKMHDNRYLNLPVMGDDNEVVGIVDVLKLTYATLEQINSMQSSGDSEGPAWNKFWMSFDNDSESVHSDSLSQPRASTPSSGFRPISSNNLVSSPPEASPSELAQFNLGSANELGPNDSVSRSGDRPGGLFGRVNDPDLLSSPLSFPFKFKAPGSGRVYRLNVSRDTSIEAVRRAIADKIGQTEVITLGGLGLIEDGIFVEGSGFAVSYIDDEGDVVAITADQDIVDAMTIFRSMGLERADLILHHPETPVDSLTQISRQEQARDAGPESPSPQVSELKNISSAKHNHEVVPGVPNELILPGAIITLAVSIILVFTFSRSR